MSNKPSYRIERSAPIRRLVRDAGYLGRRRHIVHGLIEVDITDARELIEVYEKKMGEKLSLTAFVIFCLSKAIEEHPHVQAYLDWRNRLIIYDDVNITSMFEVDFDAKKAPMPHVFRSTNRMSLLEIHQEMRSIQKEPHKSFESKAFKWFMMLPAFLRRVFYWISMRIPQSSHQLSASVMVTAVGMFGRGGGWAITMPNFTLNVTIGGISKKPGVFEDKIAIREYLDLTISVDHDVVDGAPAARFIHSLRSLLETAYGLKDMEQVTTEDNSVSYISDKT